MYFTNDNLVREGLIIGGGLMTPAHASHLAKEPDSYRLDFVHTEGVRRCMVDSMVYVMDAPNNDAIGSRYAVYKFVVGSITYFMFYVEILNPRKGTLRRGDIVCDFSSNFLHLHIKVNAYGSADKDYLHYLPYLDPRIKVSTNFGSNAYTGLNTGAQIPGDLINNDTPMIKVTQADKYYKLTSTNTATFNIRLEPKVSAKDIGDVPANYVWYSDKYAVGDNVNGNTTWYPIIVPAGEFKDVLGWASANWIKAEAVTTDCSNVQAQLDAANAKNAQLQAELDNVVPYTPPTFYIKKNG